MFLFCHLLPFMNSQSENETTSICMIAYKRTLHPLQSSFTLIAVSKDPARIWSTGICELLVHTC